ncbi:MAG: 4Fe-4S binding protein, partial [Clostridia bacterium]
MEYLDFKTAKCKNCYRCLRECPVKAIKYEDHQAKIIVDRCILCGTCTAVCPQNAKKVHSELESVEALLKSGQTVIASVAPSFVSSFGVQDFSV